MFNNHYGLESAVLEGRKTQTRRVDKRSLCLDDAVRCGHKYFRVRGKFLECHTAEDFTDCFIQFRMPYEIGEVVAIKQSYKDILATHSDVCEALHEEIALIDEGNYDYGGVPCDNKRIEDEAGYKNKMFVKNDLMSYQIKVTNIRVERLQSISDNECFSEGIQLAKEVADIHNITAPFGGFCTPFSWNAYQTPQEAFAALIDEISGKGTWKFNPYVWVIEFELVKGGWEMSWITVNYDGEERCHHNKPRRGENMSWISVYNGTCSDAPIMWGGAPLKRGAVYKRLGIYLTWKDDPVEFKSKDYELYSKTIK